jgi:hypothetical protein
MEQRCLAGEAFQFTNLGEVSRVLNLNPSSRRDNDPYILMPATYDAHRELAFVLEVVSDHDFTLEEITAVPDSPRAGRAEAKGAEEGSTHRSSTGGGEPGKKTGKKTGGKTQKPGGGGLSLKGANEEQMKLAKMYADLA